MIFALVVLLVTVWGLFRSPPDQVASPLAVPAAPGSDWDPAFRLACAWKALRGEGPPAPFDVRDARLGAGESGAVEAVGAVEGRLVLAPGDHPCPRAFVLLARVGRAPQEGVTDPTGAFRFGRVPIGRWLVRARDAEGRVVARILRVQEGRTTNLGLLRVGSRGALEVVVKDPGGTAVPGAAVRLLAPGADFQDLFDGSSDPRKPSLGEDSPAIALGETDGRGRVLLEGLDPGPGVLDVYAAGFPSAWRSVHVRDAGTPRRVVEVHLTSGRTVRGVVVDERGRAVGRASVCVYDPDDLVRAVETRWFHPVDASGRFTTTVPTGVTHWHGLVAAPGRPAQNFRVPIGEGPIRLELGAPATLVFDVRRSGTDEPAADVKLTAYGGQGRRMRLRGDQDAWMSTARTDLGGRAIVPVRPGWLHLLHVEYAPGDTESWLPAAKVQPTDSPCAFEGLRDGTLVAGENHVRIRVPPPVPPARMVGCVTYDDAPLAGVRIYVEGEVGIDPRTEAPSVTDEAGRYVVQVPRDDHVYYAAVLPGWVMRYTGIAGVGQDADEVEEDIAMQPSSAVTGRVVDEGGRGVAAVRVRIAARYDDPARERPGLGGPSFAVTGSDGSYVLDGLGSVAKAYVLASGEGYVASRSKAFSLREGTTVRAPHLVLRTSVPLRVQVLDPAGRPASRARVQAETLEEDEQDIGRDGNLLRRHLPLLFGFRGAEARTDEDGYAALSPVPPGRVSIVVSGSGFAATRTTVTHRPARAPDAVYVARLHAAYTFDVVVVDGAGAPVADAQVRLRRPGETMEAALEATEEDGLAWGWDVGYSDDSGRFAFADVPQIPLELQVEAEGFRGLCEAAPTGPATARLVLVRADPALVRRLAEVEAENRRVSDAYFEALNDETDEDGSREAALEERLEELKAERERLREALGHDG